MVSVRGRRDRRVALWLVWEQGGGSVVLTLRTTVTRMQHSKESSISNSTYVHDSEKAA